MNHFLQRDLKVTRPRKKVLPALFWLVCPVLEKNYAHHSWFIASWAVSLWSWSTSIRRATRLLAVKNDILKRHIKITLNKPMKKTCSFGWEEDSREESEIFILQTVSLQICLEHLNRRCHPSTESRTRNHPPGFFGTGSCRDFHSRRHRFRRRTEGCPTSCGGEETKSINSRHQLIEA